MNARRFKPVAKTKKGTPSNMGEEQLEPSAREKEIMRTRRRYKLGLLTPAEMDRISKQRAKG